MSENILDEDDDAVCKKEMKKDITLRKEVFKPVWREGILAEEALGKAVTHEKVSCIWIGAQSSLLLYGENGDCFLV